MKSTKNVTRFLVSLLTLIPLASIAASARELVDPNTLNPPPATTSNAVCERVGNGIICELQFSDPPSSGSSDVTCGSGANSFEPFVYNTRSVRGKRYYDGNGNLLRRHFREYFAGTFVNPLNHKALAFSGSDTHLHVLAVPETLIQALMPSPAR